MWRECVRNQEGWRKAKHKIVGGKGGRRGWGREAARNKRKYIKMVWAVRIYSISIPIPDKYDYAPIHMII